MQIYTYLNIYEIILCKAKKQQKGIIPSCLSGLSTSVRAGLPHPL